ncbi:MAG: helix-turn-helix domain-containing protein [Rubrivivax sp.]
MYHYIECGLDNVYLTNGYVIKQTPYGEGVSVQDVPGLHRMIALTLARKRGAITHKEFRFLRGYLLMSQKGLGQLVGVDEQTISLWERARRKIAPASEAVVRLLVMDSANGREEVKRIIDRMNTVERLVNQHIVASESKKSWATKLVDAPTQALVAEPA